MKKIDVLKKMQNQILVSCQAYDPNPHATVEDMVKMAVAGKLGGCVGYRANHPDYVKAIRQTVGSDDVIIGIWKIMEPNSDVYITTKMDAVDALITAGCDVVALDCTDRVNAYGYKGFDLVNKIKEKYPDIVIMADCSTIEEAKMAKDVGVDIVSSTLSGYTSYTEYKYALGVDVELLKAMKELGEVFVLAEGKIWTREDAIAAFEAGADCLVIGTAITSPWKITERFVKAKEGYFGK